MNNVTVVTGTIGNKNLKKCIESVADQTIECNHLIVIDGEEYEQKVKEILQDCSYNKDILKIVTLAYNTGANNFYQHRIIAGFAHLIPTKFFMAIDEDNWLDKTHVESLINMIEENNLDWGYSLRKIYEENGEFVCEDSCESLGNYPVYGNPQNGYLIDTSAYLYKTEWFKKVSHLWNHSWGADRRFFEILRTKLNHKNFDCTGKYTLNYRLGGNENSVKKEFFLTGNDRIAKSEYKDLPWRKSC